jgi:hypothetical protein
MVFLVPLNEKGIVYFDRSIEENDRDFLLK